MVAKREFETVERFVFCCCCCCFGCCSCKSAVCVCWLCCEFDLEYGTFDMDALRLSFEKLLKSRCGVGETVCCRFVATEEEVPPLTLRGTSTFNASQGIPAEPSVKAIPKIRPFWSH